MNPHLQLTYSKMEILKYNKVVRAHFALDENQCYRVFTPYFLRKQGVFGKTAYITFNNSNTEYRIRRNTCPCCLQPTDNSWFHKKVYVSRQSKFSRDIIRGTYTIVLDKEKADLVVIPAPQKSFNYSCSLAGVDNENNLWLIDVDRNQDIDVDINFYSDSELSLIEKYILGTVKLMGATVNSIRWIIPTQLEKDDSPYIEPKVFIDFMNTCDEYGELYHSKQRLQNYVIDTELRCAPTIHITKDTLMLWSNYRITDQLLQKSIIASDWQKYPVTVRTFLNAHFEEIYRVSCAALKEILNKLQWNTSDYNLAVTKEDYDMLSSWIMHLLGVDDSGGVVNADKFEQLSKHYKRFINSAFVVKPFSIVADGESVQKTINNNAIY